MANSLENGLGADLRRMHERAKQVFGKYYNEQRIDGATVFMDEKTWNETMDNIESALKELDERYDEADKDKQNHREAIILSALNSLDIENNLTDPDENN